MRLCVRYVSCELCADGCWARVSRSINNVFSNSPSECLSMCASVLAHYNRYNLPMRIRNTQFDIYAVRKTKTIVC